jgi:NAD(P)-dependent dehydrogenase (short-subunit alcohol dehydrogenase family)
MTATELNMMLRAGLLDGVSIVLAGAPVEDKHSDRFGVAVREACEQLGATVAGCPVSAVGEAPTQEQAAEQAVTAALDQLGDVGVLVVDGASLFAVGEGRGALISTLESTWSAVRAVANAAFLPDSRGGRVFLLAPPPDAGEMADGARAGLENLARTLSIEWARYGVTVVTVALGSETDPGEAGTLVAYLASPAGSYFSGCLLDLRGPG